MNKKWLGLAFLVLAIPTFVCAQSAFIDPRHKKAGGKFDPRARWKHDRAQRREDEIFCCYIEMVRQQIWADMEIGKRAMQRAGVWDENGALTAKYHDLDGK